MNFYTSITFYLFCFGAILSTWLFVSRFPKKVHFLFFFFTLLAIFLDISRPYKILTFTFFYVSIIYLAQRFNKIPKLIYILIATSPLFFFKLSELHSSLSFLSNRFGFIGISYITFRVIQIITDLETTPPSSYTNIFTFLLNPLTLLAGPIDRLYRFENNISSISSTLTKENIIKGWYFLCVGILQKFVFGFFWDKYISTLFSSASKDLINILGTAYSFSVSLYFDFAGYSLMAVGISYMMGIQLPINFDKPWQTANPQDLWRRFHITLGSFLSDYFFKPIYMHLIRKSFFKFRKLLAQNIALFLTFLLMGIWNGLKWYYITSGIMFGISSVIYNTYVNQWRKKPEHILHIIPIPIYRFIFLNYIIWALYLFSGKLPI